MNEITMKDLIIQKLDYIQTSLQSIKMQFFRIGKYMYFIKENFDQAESFITYGEETYLPKSQYAGWLQLLKDAFDMSESTIYKYMTVYLKFSDHPVFKEYGLTQLTEMLSVPIETLEVMHLTQDMTVREIRKKVKNALALDKPPEDVDNDDDEDLPDDDVDNLESTEDEETQMSVDNYENQMEEDQRKIDAIKRSIDMTMQSFNSKIKYKEMEIKDSPKNMKIRGHLEQLQADQKILQGMLDHIDEIYRSNEFRWL
jgi:hypothetical protein